MQQDANTTYVQYSLLQGSAPLEMELKALVNYRNFHGATHAGDWRMRVDAVEHGVKVVAFDGATPFYLLSAGAACEARHEWHRGCVLLEERRRGLDDHEDHLFAALFRARVEIGESFAIVMSTEATAALHGGAARVQRTDHESRLLSAWSAPNQYAVAGAGPGAPEWLPQLGLAADQFVGKRALPEDAHGRSVIAGYDWFGDWGRAP